jgi:hypothetical protein
MEGIDPNHSTLAVINYAGGWRTNHLVDLVGKIDVGGLELIKHILDALAGTL